MCVHDSSPCSFSFCKHCFFSGQMQMYILVSLPFSWFVCLFFLPVEITFFFCLNRFSCLNINRTWGVSVFMCVCVCSWWFFLLLYFALLRMCVCVCVYRCWLLRCLLLDDVLKREGKKKDLARV